MNNILSNVLIFSAGAAVGSTVAYLLLKNKYEQIAQEEIDSVKEMYAKKNDISVTESDTQPNEAEVEEYKKLTEEYGYENDEEKGGSNDMEVKPYVISPDEYGELDGYDVESLVYYADGILADNNNDPIENIDAVVGSDFATHFGEYEDDSVFIRNERLKCDYEILKDYQTYKDVVDPNLEDNE